jgi:mannonate dehydratase
MKTTRRTLLFSPAALALPRQPAWIPMISENIPSVDPVMLRWLKQMGCTHAIFQGTDSVDHDKKGYWTADDVLRIKKSCEEESVKLYSMMIPIDFYLKARLGKPGRDEEIEKVCLTVYALGEAGIPMAEWRFWPDFYWDDRVGYYRAVGRGGASLAANDYDRVKGLPPFPEIGVVSEQEMWTRFLYFARPLLAAAEKANVRLAMHPNDPPVPVMRGVARIFHHTDGLRRLLKELPSPINGITFCQGTITEMGVDVLQEIRHFGRQGKIFLVHLRGVRGRVPHYQEVFIDEGDVDMLQAMRAYKECGYTGPIVSDHTPELSGDTAWGLAGRSYAHGYIRALVQAVNAM